MKYKKRPVIIEAVQWTGENHRDIDDFCGDAILNLVTPNDPKLVVRTLEGDMTASVGDYIIKGVKGEFYPCKPDVFAETYEPAVAPLKEEKQLSPFWDYIKDRYRDDKTFYNSLHKMITRYEAKYLVSPDHSSNGLFDLYRRMKRHLGEYLHDLEICAEARGVEL